MKHVVTALGLVLLGVGLWLGAAQAQQGGPSEHPYVGTKNCKKCHIKEWKSWEDTNMAQAYDTLKPGERVEAKTKHGLDPQKDYTKDATCLECHTTGYGSEGGFTSIEDTPELAGVSCEACHGAGGTYTQDQYMSLKNKEYKRSEVVAVGLVHPINKEVCTACHNANNPTNPDEDFDFENRKHEGVHEIYPLKYDHD